MINESRIHILLDHINSLGIVSVPPMRRSEIKTLLERGFIRQVYIGSYALTDAGKRVRKGS